MPAACVQQEARGDAALVALCNGGDAQERARAFDALYRCHRGFVLFVAHRFTHDEDAAADIAQETFLYLLRRFPPVGDGIHLQAKLDTLLYPFRCVMRLRAKKGAEACHTLENLD